MRSDRDVYFNEIDVVACAVLRECNPGVVDQRSIKEVTPDDVQGFERAHFFAGAGLWQVAADMAGWRGPLWTASCPCQPFSVAGKGAGRDDPRHLWPDFFRLARAVRPPVIVGEQVAGSAGFDWFDGVAADLEGEGYACRAVDIPACAVDAPHRRQRLYWVAVADAGSWRVRDSRRAESTDAASQIRGEVREQRVRVDPRPSDDCQPMADADGGGCGGWPQDALRSAERRDAAERADGGLEHAPGERRGEGRTEHELWRGGNAAAGANGASDVGDAAGARQQGSQNAEWFEGGSPWRADAQRTNRRDGGSFWAGAEWIDCADGKARRSKSRVRLLVNGMAGRADLWRLAGNSIVPQIAAEVLSALAESLIA